MPGRARRARGVEADDGRRHRSLGHVVVAEALARLVLDAHVSRTRLVLDDEGRKALAKELGATITAWIAPGSSRATRRSDF
jgi:hypothetical protein